MKFAKARNIPALLTVALLLGLSAETLHRPGPEDADPHHARVYAIGSNLVIPKDWTFDHSEVSQKLPDGAVSLLKPNLTICRVFLNPHFQFLLVQCHDARDMGGHYPPVCYPASGCVAVGNDKGEIVNWTIGSKTFVGKEYEFSHLEDGQTRTQIVDNLLILPLGPLGTDFYVTDISKVRAFASDYTRRFYGAAQVQFVFDGTVPEIERRDIVTQLIGKNMDLFTALERSE